MQSTLNRLPFRKFIKFIIVGSIGAGIQLGITYLLTEFANLYYMVSLVIAIILATVWNFTGNLRWTFKGKV